MILLVAIIILPPVLRLLMPKNPVEPIKTEKIEALICNKQDISTGITYRATATYKSDALIRLTLLYSNNNSSTTEDTTNPFETIQEISSFEKITGVNVTQNNNQIKVDISQNVLANSKDDEFLSTYQNDITQEQLMFEEQGYTCQVTSTD